jgi:serine/threonine protein phosphatase PrpC
MQKLQDITFTGKTNKGLKRDHNEDNYVSTILWNSSVLLCCIDGVGGLAGGAVCSAAVAVKMEQYLKEMQPSGDLSKLLKNVLVKVNNDIIALQNEMPGFNKMACVVTTILVDTKFKNVYMAHVGDTRLYEFAEGKLVKLSHDHSPIGLREEMGILTEEEAMSHPKRNIIERCIGDVSLENDTDYIEIAIFPFKPGATYLLCSDGLTDLVTSAEISQILSEDTDIDNKTDKLIAAANNAGGKDNITVLLLNSPDNRTEEERLADTLVDNETIGRSEARLVPDNETVVADTSYLVQNKTSDKEKEKLETTDIEEDLLLQTNKPESKNYKDVKYKRNGKNHFLGLIILALLGIIIWMGWELHTLKQNQIRMMNVSILIQATVNEKVIQQLDDSLMIDSTKFVMTGDSLHQIVSDSLLSDSLVTNN